MQQRRGLLKTEKVRLYRVAHNWSQQLQDALVWMIETPLRKQAAEGNKEAAAVITSGGKTKVLHKSSHWSDRLEASHQSST